MKKLLFIFALLMCMSITWAQNVAKIGSTEYATLQAAVDDAYVNMTGDVTIELIADIEAYTVVRQKSGLNLTIDGGNKTINGQILIDGMGHLTSETLMIKDINFTGTGTTVGFTSMFFISVPTPSNLPSPYTASRLSDAHNITIDSCSFNSTSTETPDNGLAAVSTSSGTQCNNLTVQNCTGTNLHSLVQVSGTTGLTVDGCTLTNSESFIGVQGGGGTYTVQNCNFSTNLSTGYGLRSKSNSAAEITLSGNVFSASNANVLQLGKGGGQDSNGSIYVESGEYYGNIVNAQSASATAEFVFTGGTYSSDVTPDCAEGYRAVSNGDGTWTVGPIVVAKIGTTGYATLNAAAAAVPVGTPTTITILQNLNFYDITGNNLTNKTITFTGTATDTLTLTNSAHAKTAAYGADLTFENITLKNDNTADVYRGIIHVNKVTINNCEILGFMMGYANQFTCNNCTFTASCKYHMWTYGSNCTFNSCTFNSSYNLTGGKAINVYTDQSYDRRIITFNDCTFNATNHSGNSSAIQINSEKTCFVIYANNCTVSGYTNSESTAVPGYEDLANNKSTSVATTLYVDGVRLLNQGGCDNVAKIGSTYFSSIQDAVDYANDNLTGNVTIDLVKNTSEIVKILQKDGISITLNGNGSTLTGQIFISSRQESPAYVGTYTAPNTVTIDNLNMKYDPAYYDDNGSATESGLIYFCKNCAFGNVLNYSHNVTISNCDFDADGSSKSIYAISSIAGTVFNLKIENCTAKNALGLATLQSAPQFEVTGCSTEDVTYGIRVVNNNGPLTMTHNNFSADEVGILFQNCTTGADLMMDEDTVNAPVAFQFDNTVKRTGADEGKPGIVLNVTSGIYTGEIVDNSVHNADTSVFYLTGGTYSKDMTGEPCAPGYAAFANGTTPETWTVTKAWFLYYDKNEVGAEGTMDTLFVKQSGTDAERTIEVADCAFTWLPDHTFDKWNDQAGGGGNDFNPGDNITLTSDITLYVVWKLGYTIFYDANGGTGTIPNQSKDPGVDITLSDGTDGAGNYLITKTDSTLYRWNTEADESGDNYDLGGTYSADANDTLYAVWRLNLDMTMDSTDVRCYGENNGADTVKIIGGDTPFQLVLSGAALTENDTVKNIMDRTYIFENLKPGSYTVTLTDVLGKDTITGTFTIAQPDTLIVETMTVPEKPCPLMGVGEYNVSMTTTGGNGDNHFAWTGAEDVDAMATTVVPGTDDRDSTYTVTVTVTDKKGCTATGTETFTVSPVIADDGTIHSNTKMTIDTIKQGIMQGCDTIIRDFGTPNFAFTNPAIDENILDTIYNDIPTNYPDSIFPVGYSTIIWTAVDTCGHEVTGEQVIYIYHYPCPSVDDAEGNTYNGVRVGCLCWTDRNMVSTKYSSNGNDIPNLMSYVSETFPDATENVAKFGYLYDWYAAADTVTNSIADIEATYAAGKHVQGVCPNGWYLPTDEDFKTLESVDAKDLRSTDLWLEGGGTNATGFNAVPGGFYNCSTGRFEDAAGNAYYWSCHPVYDKATGAMIDYICEKIYNSKDYSRCNGFSVRCVLIYGE